MQHATKKQGELDLCGTYDDTVSVNTSAYGDGIRHALASIGAVTQCARCTLGRSFADNWSTAWHRPLPTTPMIIVPLPTPPLPTTTAANKTRTVTSSCCYAMLLEHHHLISKYWFANGRPETVTYGRKKSADSDSDGLGGKIRGFGCWFGIRNNTN